jgi:hypothetical protein
MAFWRFGLRPKANGYRNGRVADAWYASSARGGS